VTVDVVGVYDQTDDITFQAQLDSTEVRAAVYEARPRLRLHFTQVLNLKPY
jgi:hypothetical protein